MEDVAWRKSTASSTPGAEPIGCNRTDDQQDALLGIKGERVATYGHPAVFLPITPGGGVTALGDYPNDGAGVAQGGSAATITLAADAPTYDLTGMLVLLFGGTGLGQYRRIQAYNGATKLAAIADGTTWSTLPIAGTTYRILIPCLHRNELHVHGELEAAATSGALVQAALYDYPQGPTAVTKGGVGVAGAARRASRFMDVTLALNDLIDTTDVLNAGYRHAQTRTVPCRGALGAKWRLTQAPSGGGRIYLEACAT